MPKPSKGDARRLPQVMVLRDEKETRLFRWQVRAYNCGMSLVAGSESFRCIEEARRAGERALTQWEAETAAGPGR